MRRFGLIGTVTSDHVIVEDHPPLRSLGGILYNAAVLCGLGETVELFANCGADLRPELEAATAEWRSMDRAGLRLVPGSGNQVHLHYSERLKEREEVLASAVPPLDPAPIVAALPRLDMLLMVFNSGFEFSLVDWRCIVDAAGAGGAAGAESATLSACERTAAVPIWLDVHSFVLAKIVGAHRDYVSVPDWRAWFAGVALLQANRQEVASLRGHPERWPSRAEIESFAGEAFGIGIRAVFVTMGKDGILMLTPERPAGTQIAAPAADLVVDTTGCGDVFCAQTMRLLARGLPLEDAARAGVVLASKAVGLAGIGETFELARRSQLTGSL